MRQNQQSNKNRMRGRSSRKGPNPLTRTFESNGPDLKIRGTALHIAEKYTQLARDASSSGDRVMAENYLQHAEHYYRVIAAAQAALQPPTGQPRDDNADDADDDLEPIGSDRFEPRHIDMRVPNGNGQYGQQDASQPGRGDYDRSDQRGDGRGRDRTYETGPDRGQQDRGQQERGQQERGQQDRSQQDRGQQDRSAQERPYQDRGGRDRNDRRPRYERNTFGDRRGEREPRAFEPRPAPATTSHPMPLDAPQPDVAFPEPVVPVTAGEPVVPQTDRSSATGDPGAARSEPPQIDAPAAAGPAASAVGSPDAEEKPARRRRTPRPRKTDTDGENSTPEPSAVE
jgi:hypothetical protein